MMKKILLIALSVCLCFASIAQISDYQHPPTILGHERLSIKPGDQLTLKTADLLLHDLDEADFSKYSLLIAEGQHYTLDGNTIIPDVGFEGYLYVPVTVFDGKYRSGTCELEIWTGETPGASGEKKGLSFFVSPYGNDDQSGQIDAPLKTLEAARNKVRAYKKEYGMPPGGITVFLREGEYFLSNTFELNEEDSGDKGRYISYQAYPGEQVRLTGSKPIAQEWIEKAPAEIIQKIRKPEARQKVRMVQLRKQGLTAYGTIEQVGYAVRKDPLPAATLFINGRAQHLARYPNTENFKDVSEPVGKKQFTSRSGIVTKWENTGDIWINGALSKAWEWQKNRIADISPEGQIRMQWDYHSEIEESEPRMFYFNILEELDAPGEFFIDRKAGMLYFIPEEDISPGDELRISQSGFPLLSLTNTRYLQFYGLTFEGTRHSAIELKENCYRNRIEACTIHSIGLDGIDLSGTENKMYDLHLHDIGANGFIIRGGDEQTLEPARNLVENCLVHDFSQQRKAYNPGFTIYGVGQVVRHTELFNGPHMGMRLKGNDHLVEYCDIHHVPKEYADMLGVYMNTGSSPLQRGTIIRRNTFHDVNSPWKQSAGVYLDNETHGVLVEENYFYDNLAGSSGWATMIHGGADNIIRKNVYLNCSFPFFISLRLNGYAADHFAGLLDRWSEAFQNNATAAYFYHYPELRHYFDDENIQPDMPDFRYDTQLDQEGNILNYWDRRTPATNVFSHNLIYNPDPEVFAMPATNPQQALENRGFYSVKNFRLLPNGKRADQLIHQNNHYIQFNPGFLDIEARNLNLTPEKIQKEVSDHLPHLLLIPFEKIGRY